MSVDIKKLEELTKAATPGPWEVKTLPTNPDFHYAASDNIRSGMVCYGSAEDIAYITAACNAVPELIAENRALQKRVQELEKQRNWLAYKHAVACIDAACDSCTTHIGDCPICPISQETGLCIEVSEVTFINAAEEATKEAGNDR